MANETNFPIPIPTLRQLEAERDVLFDAILEDRDPKDKLPGGRWSLIAELETRIRGLKKEAARERSNARRRANRLKLKTDIDPPVDH